jgi:hypothetical protein
MSFNQVSLIPISHFVNQIKLFLQILSITCEFLEFLLALNLYSYSENVRLVSSVSMHEFHLAGLDILTSP